MVKRKKSKEFNIFEQDISLEPAIKLAKKAAKIVLPSEADKLKHEKRELDALEPSVLNDLIQKAIRKYLDVDLFNKRLRKQEKERKLLIKISKDWDKLTSRKKK